MPYVMYDTSDTIIFLTIFNMILYNIYILFNYNNSYYNNYIIYNIQYIQYKL